MKFNFDTVNDPDDDRWLEFDCVKCSIERLEREEQSVGVSEKNQLQVTKAGILNFSIGQLF